MKMDMEIKETVVDQLINENRASIDVENSEICIGLSGNEIRGNVDSNSTEITVDDARIVYVGGDRYTGTTEITPSTERQVLNTAYHIVDSNIVVNPIPQNYGLISWNGFYLKVE